MNKIGVCEVCSAYGTIELHHVTKKSQAKFLEKCQLNFKYLCPKCHRSEKGVHGRNGRKLDLKIRTEMQNKLELLFLDREFTKEQVGQALMINNKATDSLCKTIRQNKGVFYREDIIRGCMGGILLESEENNDNT